MREPAQNTRGEATSPDLEALLPQMRAMAGTLLTELCAASTGMISARGLAGEDAASLADRQARRWERTLREVDSGRVGEAQLGWIEDALLQTLDELGEAVFVQTHREEFGRGEAGRWVEALYDGVVLVEAVRAGRLCAESAARRSVRLVPALCRAARGMRDVGIRGEHRWYHLCASRGGLAADPVWFVRACSNLERNIDGGGGTRASSVHQQGATTRWHP